MEKTEETSVNATSTNSDPAPASDAKEASDINASSSQAPVAEPSTTTPTVDENAEHADDSDAVINIANNDNDAADVAKSVANHDENDEAAQRVTPTVEQSPHDEELSIDQGSQSTSHDPEAVTRSSDQREPTEQVDDNTKRDDNVQLYQWNYIMAEIGLENVKRYNKGGFHPVILGDMLDDRYQVVGKLGSGGFGTVWMCRELKLKHWRAIKIMAADHSVDSREMKTFDLLRKTSTPEELEANHIGTPLETFWVEGPNGKHLCLVMPIYGPSIQDWRWDQDYEDPGLHTTTTEVCGQITRSLAFLHERRICHGDFRPSNILMRIDENALAEIDEDVMDDILGELEAFSVLTLSGEVPDARAPKYLITAVSSEWCKKFIIPEIVITDFGESFHSPTTRKATGIPLPYSPPENTFVLGASLEVDLWALGCTFFEVFTGSLGPLFSISSLSGVTPEEDIIGQQEVMLGPLPEPFISEFNKIFTTMRPPDFKCDPSEVTATWTLAGLEWQRNEDTKDSEYDDVLQANIAIRMPDLAPESRRDHVIAVTDAIYALLRWHPSERMSARNILQLDWLKDTKSARTVVVQENVPGDPQQITSSLCSDTPDLAAGKGTFDNPRVVWLSDTPRRNRLEVDTLLQQQASRMKQSYVWVMKGVHFQTTVGRTNTRTNPARNPAIDNLTPEDQYTEGLRIMAQDDPHLTVRFGPDKDTCTLHGHLYVHMTPKEIGPNNFVPVPSGRLMTEAERTYVGGRPRHLWIWGPYNRECPAWPRSKIVLPKPDERGRFEKKK
ncbi:kinase-like domain-containing protein [Xylariaceae sp. FL1272]|nr:kinase-like domain-containing protein [Xylariaceae sp. FL1272]